MDMCLRNQLFKFEVLKATDNVDISKKFLLKEKQQNFFLKISIPSKQEINKFIQIYHKFVENPQITTLAELLAFI